MKAAIFYGGGVVKIEEVDKPEPGPTDAVVKVEYCGICGSDRHKFFEGWPFPLRPENKPKPSELKRLKYIPGHEVTGTVDTLGNKVRGFKKGDPVAIYCIKYCGKCYYCKRGMSHYCVDFDKGIMSDHWDGGYAEYVRVPAKNLMKLPADIPVKLGNLSLDTVGVPYGAFKEMKITKDSSIAIYGCGPIGLAAIKVLKQRQATNHIFAVDIVQKKLDLAKEFGAKRVINAAAEDPGRALREGTDGLGVDMAFDTSNTVDAFRNAIYSVRKGGNVYAIGEHASLPPDLAEVFVSDILIHRHLGVRGLMYFSISEHKHILDALRRGRASYEKLITNVFPLERIDEAFNLFFRDNQAIRVLIKPQQ